MRIEKELQAEIKNNFQSDGRVVISGYSYDLMPPAPDHFWIKVGTITNYDIIFLSDLIKRYTDPFREVLTIQIDSTAKNLIKISFF